MNCPYCGNYYYETDNICHECGYSIPEEKIAEGRVGEQSQKVGEYLRKESEQKKIKQEKESIESQNCFIATTAFNSSFAPEVLVLKEFRDRFLDKFFLGHLFVVSYYWFSPPIADFLNGHETAKVIVCRLLTLITKLVKRLN